MHAMPTTLIEPAALLPHLGDPQWAVIDCRFDLARPEWGAGAYRAAHIPSARYAHLERDLSGPRSERTGRHPLPDPTTLAATLGRLGIDATVQVIAYDQGSGAFAARLWWLLRWLGHHQVAVLDGGFAAWERAALPVSSADAARPARRFRARAGPLAAGQHHGSFRRRRLRGARERRGHPGRCAQRRALCRRERDHRPGGRAHPRGSQPSLQRQPRCARTLPRRRRAARGLAAHLARRRSPPADRHVWLGRDRLPRPAGARGGGAARRAAVRRLLERVDLRPSARGGARSVSAAPPLHSYFTRNFDINRPRGSRSQERRQWRS